MSRLRLVEMQPKFLMSDWHQANRMHYGNVEAKRLQSERLVAESQRLVEESDKATQRMQQEVNQRLEWRIKDIRFWKQELELKLNDMVEEIETLLTTKTRVERALESCSEPLRVTLQCMLEREKRVGIDLVHDDVERELIKEKEVIEGVSALLQRTLEQINEQIRLNRSVKYYLEKDLRDKVQAEQIDDYCSNLSNTSINIPHTVAPIPTTGRATVTPKEWEQFSDLNMSKAEREKNNSVSLRVLVDSLLEQTASDMRKAHQAVGTALELCIQETKSAKRQLEENLAKVLEEMARQEKSMASLRAAIEDKRAPLSVAQERLAARSQRPRIELCHDSPQAQLYAEVQKLDGHIQRLNRSLFQSEVELRALRSSQLTLEEEILVKANSLYIDEVICTQLRQPIVVQNF
ncbi:tektin-1-like [Scleropages formosus]|uniref:Tektin n=1 Tax=Scleropages formosus TaxID=113540 RepID=A0A0P7VIT2_SCLFO|nr:tektin-1-like [Scleropages formosus]